ncbi:exodeoxyribonuclease VII small subunit [Sphingomicrobium sp. XHP0235]|uniref:exodeoxyribonuclease VII small subunit n=1 Tax=Sphingomicrobium aquimarinum TaxID=3133971 RepID=UPI0031FF2177
MTDATAPTPVDQLEFEAALAELEQIVRQLEQGDASLEKSIELFKRGEELKKHCEKRLADAREKIEQITRDDAGNVTGTKPFDADG